LGCKDDLGDYEASEELVRFGHHAHMLYSWVFTQNLLDLLRIDLVPAAINDALLTAPVRQSAAFVFRNDVTRVEPLPLGEGNPCAIAHKVSTKETGTTNEELSELPDGGIGSIVTNNPCLIGGLTPSERSGVTPNRVVPDREAYLDHPVDLGEAHSKSALEEVGGRLRE
jgi:hypothetical protein